MTQARAVRQASCPGAFQLVAVAAVVAGREDFSSSTDQALQAASSLIAKSRRELLLPRVHARRSNGLPAVAGISESAERLEMSEKRSDEPRAFGCQSM